MQNEFRNAYTLSQQTTDYEPDARDIGNLRDRGYFVVVSQTTAYCRHTDASLPNPVTRIARDRDGKALIFQTEEGAQACIRKLHENEDHDETTHAIREPSFDEACWQSSFVSFVSGMSSMDREDARRWCAKNREDIMAMHGNHMPPAVAAAEFCRRSQEFDFEAWKAAHRPEAPEMDTEPETKLPF